MDANLFAGFGIHFELKYYIINFRIWTSDFNFQKSEISTKLWNLDRRFVFAGITTVILIL